MLALNFCHCRRISKQGEDGSPWRAQPRRWVRGQSLLFILRTQSFPKGARMVLKLDLGFYRRSLFSEPQSMIQTIHTRQWNSLDILSTKKRTTSEKPPRQEIWWRKFINISLCAIRHRNKTVTDILPIVDPNNLCLLPQPLPAIENKRTQRWRQCGDMNIKAIAFVKLHYEFQAKL